MNRVEQIGDCTLYLGDALQVVPELPSCDAMVTDPVWPNCPAGADIANAGRPWELWRQFWNVCPIPRRAVVALRCDSDPRFLSIIPADLPFFRSIQLSYVIPGYLGRALGGDETAYWFGSVIASAPGRRVVPGRAPSAQPSARPPNGHPMSRAQVHFDWLVDWCSDAGDVVCDPFMGSGTTGVACAKLGRKFVGIEVVPKYFDLACRRIEAAYSQQDWIAKIGLPVQELML